MEDTYGDVDAVLGEIADLERSESRSPSVSSSGSLTDANSVADAVENAATAVLELRPEMNSAFTTCRQLLFEENEFVRQLQSALLGKPGTDYV